MTIDVIIPNYNGSHLIEKNVPAVITALQAYKNAIIRIVDDGSREEEQKKLAEVVEKLQKKSPVEIILQENKKNVGFSSNVNRGAFASKADFLVLLNSDVAPDKDFLQAVLPHFEKDDQLFGVGCTDKSVEGKEIILRGRGIGYWSRGFIQHTRGEVDREDTFWISGGSSVIRRDIFEKLMGFDPLFNPFYWEDIDLSYRAQKAGYSILFERKSEVTHWHEEGAIKAHNKSDRIKTIAFRNQFTLIWKDIDSKRLLFSHIVWLPYYFVKTLSDRDTTFTKGFFLALGRLPAIMQARTRQKRYYKCSDHDILNHYKR